jgi:ElaB/YqjD/DUF883 family membrane-anchored ribosome-binding protein
MGLGCALFNNLNLWVTIMTAEDTTPRAADAEAPQTATHDSFDLEFLRREFARFRDELASVKSTLGEEAHEALERIGAHLDGADIKARVATLEDRLGELSATLKGKGKDAAEKLEHKVTEKPLTAVAVAFGAGLVLASLLRRP